MKKAILYAFIALAVVFAEKRGITALPPEVVDGFVRIAENEHEA